MTKSNLAGSSFFAFLAMVLIAVCAALFLNIPPESNAATSNGTRAMDSGYDYIEPADAPPVIDAHLEPDDVTAQKPQV